MFGHGSSDVATIEVDADELALLCGLVRALRPRYAIETGSYHGTTSAAIGRELAIGSLDTMETDEYSVGMARQACVGLPVTVHHCDALDFIPTQPIDFAFLDSGIGDQRLRELDYFAPYLASNAIVAMHDARDLPWPQGWRFVNLPTCRGLLLLEAS